MIYPFIISRRKLVRITADDYPTALNKVLMKYPVKIVTTTFARNLSLKILSYLYHFQDSN